MLVSKVCQQQLQREGPLSHALAGKTTGAEVLVIENRTGRALTSLKWTSCMPTSSIMEASSSMFGVITLKAVQPCLNMPRIETAGERVSY